MDCIYNFQRKKEKMFIFWRNRYLQARVSSVCQAFPRRSHGRRSRGDILGNVASQVSAARSLLGWRRPLQSEPILLSLFSISEIERLSNWCSVWLSEVISDFRRIFWVLRWNLKFQDVFVRADKNMTNLGESFEFHQVYNKYVCKKQLTNSIRIKSVAIGYQSCWAWKVLKDEYLVIKVGHDTFENEPLKIK